MFRIMSGKSRKKSSKEKNVDNKPKYQEDFNEVILNDLVPEEKRKELGIEIKEEPKAKSKSKKSGGIKLNMGLGGKKTSKSNNASSTPKESASTEGKQSKKTTSESTSSSSKKGSKSTKESSKDTKSSKGSKSTKESSKDTKSSKGSKSTKESSKDTKSNKSTKESTKGSKKGSSKKSSSKAKNSSIENFQSTDAVNEIYNVPQNNKVIGPKKKKSKHSQDEFENEVRTLDNEEYVCEDNLDIINFRGNEEIVEEEVIQEAKVEEKQTNKFEPIVWSEDRFPKN